MALHEPVAPRIEIRDLHISRERVGTIFKPISTRSSEGSVSKPAEDRTSLCVHTQVAAKLCENHTHPSCSTIKRIRKRRAELESESSTVLASYPQSDTSAPSPQPAKQTSSTQFADSVLEKKP